MTRTANIRKLDYVYWSSPVTSFASSAISPEHQQVTFTNGHQLFLLILISSEIGQAEMKLWL